VIGVNDSVGIDIGMFPGQGSQYLGMGRQLFERYPEHCAQATQVLGYSLPDICLKDEDKLNETRYTQPAVYMVSCLDYLAWMEDTAQGVPSAFVGHSAGLFAALYAGGAVDFLDGLRIVAKRGELMQQVSGGMMMAVISSDISEIEHDLARQELFDIEIANFNNQEQVVVTGTTDAVRQASERLQAIGYRCIPLPVSGAFHSRHMEPCRQELMAYLLDFEFKNPAVTVVSTTTGEAIDRRRLLEEITSQLVRPIRWFQTIRSLATGADLSFHEFGPGTVLTNLNQSILQEVHNSPRPKREG